MKLSLKTVFTVLVLSMCVSGVFSAWQVEVVDGMTGDAGKFACLKVDAYDMPHIAYIVENPDSLKYAWYQGSQWAFEVPAGTAGMGEYLDMELDARDIANISHFDTTDTQLMFTTRPSGGSLETVELDTFEYTGLFTAIDLDSDDDPNIAYLRADNDQIKCARRHNNAWTYYNVAMNIDPSNIDIATDSSDIMHLVFNDHNTDTLIYNSGDGVSWSPYILDSNVIVSDCKIMLDSSDNPHVMYIDSLTADLKYAWRNGSTWNIETALEDASAAVSGLSFALDANNVPHACFYSLVQTLVYFNRVGGTWQGDAIDDDGDVGHHCSMDIDSNGYVHVAYVDRDNKDLKYARQLPPNTPTPTVTPTATPMELTTKLVMEDTYMTANETFLLERMYNNSLGSSIKVDEYILLDVLGMFWFWPNWSETLDYSQWTIPSGGPTTDTILTFQWPVVDGEFSGIRFWGAFLEANTMNLLVYDMIEWGYGTTPPPLTLTSTAFNNGEAIPVKYTCDSIDVSPELTWNQPTQMVQSYAIIMDDPDAPGGDWVHWVIYDIPSETQMFAEDVPNDAVLPDGSVQGNNSWNTLGYRGPCPPSGSTHRYFFKLYALDSVLGLPSGATKEELLNAMDGHILYQTELMGTYQR